MDKIVTHTIKVSFERDREEYQRIEALAPKLGVSVNRLVELVVSMGLYAHVRENLETAEKMKDGSNG